MRGAIIRIVQCAWRGAGICSSCRRKGKDYRMHADPRKHGGVDTWRYATRKTACADHELLLPSTYYLLLDDSNDVRRVRSM